MNIDSIMSKDIITKDSNTPIWEVARIMNANNIGFIPITNDQKIIGVISDRDICVRCCKENSNLQTPISDFITKDIITVTVDDSVSHVLRVMADNKIKRLLVKDGSDNKIIGILSLSDIVNHYSSISELISVIQSIWAIDCFNQKSNSEINSFDL